MIGTKIIIRLRMGTESARHFSVIDGAKILSLFTDAAAELLIRLDGDEGLFRAYETVEFLAPVFAGDFLEVSAELVKIGETSRQIRFEAKKVITNVRQAGIAPTAADPLVDPIIVCRAVGTCVTPKDLQRKPRELYVPQLPASPLQGPGPVVTPASDRGPRTLASLESHAPEIILTAVISAGPPLNLHAIGDDAARCREAGASVISLSLGPPSETPAQPIVEHIRKQTDCIIQVSTNGLAGMPLEERVRYLDAKPDMASIMCGSINVADNVFVTTRPQIRELAMRSRAAAIAIELECFDVAHVEEALTLALQNNVATPLHFMMMLGVAGGIGATEANLRYMTSLVPQNATWGVSSVGPNRQPILELAMRLGGHARISRDHEKNEPTAPAVMRAATYAKSLGRSIVDPARARTLLLGGGPGPTMEMPQQRPT